MWTFRCFKRKLFWNCELGKFILKSAKEIKPDIVTVIKILFLDDESEGIIYLNRNQL